MPGSTQDLIVVAVVIVSWFGAVAAFVGAVGNATRAPWWERAAGDIEAIELLTNKSAKSHSAKSHAATPHRTGRRSAALRLQ